MTENVQKQSENMGMTIPAGVLTRVFGAGAEGTGGQGGTHEAADFLLSLSPEQMWEVSVRRPLAILRILQDLPVGRRVSLLAAPKVLYALSTSQVAPQVWEMVEGLDDDAKTKVLRADGAMRAALGDAVHTQRLFAFVRRLSETGRHEDAARILDCDKGMEKLFVIGRERDLVRVIADLPNGGAKSRLLDLYRAVERDFVDTWGEFVRPRAVAGLHP